MTVQHPLSGRTIAVTASRKAEEHIAALERKGATVIHAPTMRIVPVEDDAMLIEETHALLAAAPPTFFVTTGQGINSWLEILTEPLKTRVLEYLAGTQIICGGAKGRVTAEPLVDVGLAPLYPQRERVGAMITLMAESLSV